ncbi:LacI family DNA-binding transcriptional regulator [Streptomyces rubellomurinus]|uniref:LacI family transcriptional regulator n=2 Tax=Streptomyces TaxID=1883 RepID=A0A0F2TEV3_STRR3|nr:LacI family DNA-binding transcriptional regulator [Streptomyces rubellomurinus]KJS56114.1 LacI family transcriptional regulator [Streptomyces rubellomurinus subsp. indigoferus]KJS61664.1 LacI family transcriptional regulator [Streptomyces rubellomurinus]
MGTDSAGTEQRQPVMADVAKLAGVSHQTVSRVLNGAPHVRPDTRDRVLAAIRELDYRPNSAARTLVTRRSQTLGVVSFDSTLYGPASMLDGIERAARSAGYFVSVTSLRSLDGRSVQEAVDRLRDQGVEGVVVIAPQTSSVSPLAKLSSSVPLVAVGSGNQTHVPMVSVSNGYGAGEATGYLLDLGHRTVHHVAGPANWLESRDREEGWRLTLRAAGAPVPEVQRGDWSARSGYQAGLRLARLDDVTAVFCANDHMALGLLRALHEAARSVPHEISVIGFDDIPEAAYFTPPLTTVRQDFGELGRRALELLVGELEGAAPSPAHVQITPEMVVRRSVGPPAWR